LREAVASPGGPNTDRSDPAAAGSLWVVPSGGHDGLIGPDEEPERRVMIRLRDLPFPPLLERRRLELPVLRKRLLERFVERTRVLGGERLDSKALGEPGSLRRGIAQLARPVPPKTHPPL